MSPLSRLIVLPLLILTADATPHISSEHIKGANPYAKDVLKLMTFNTWNLGRNVDEGLVKIAKHIRLVDPDVVGIQEVTNAYEFAQLMKELGSKWQAAYIDGSNTAVITKHKIVHSQTYTVQAGLGTTVLIGDGSVPIHVYSMHLAYKAYGPYAANNKLVVDSKVMDIGEYLPSYSRFNNVKNLINDEIFKRWLKLSFNAVPLVVFGDFNCPSHLDWTEATKTKHGNWAYKWPATLLLQSKTKLIDSFREVYPDPVEHPGNTWSTVNKFTGVEWNYTIPEPQDRIDFIYYRSARLKTVESETYAGDFKPYPYNVRSNDWPTDHYAVVSKLVWINREFNDDNK